MSKNNVAKQPLGNRAPAVTSVTDGRLPELENEIQAKLRKAEGLPAKQSAPPSHRVCMVADESKMITLAL